MSTPIVRQFLSFYGEASRHRPRLYLADYETLCREVGIAVTRLLNGGSKSGFIKSAERISRRLDDDNRLFLVSRLSDLQACLMPWGADYARKIRAHEKAHASTMLAFRPGHGEPRWSVVFGLYVTSNPAVTPLTLGYLPVRPYGLRSVMLFPKEP